MENALLVVIVLLSLLVLALFGIVLVFLIKFMKMKEVDKSQPTKLDETLTGKKIPNDIKEAIEEAKQKSGQNMLGRACVDHPDLPAKGLCSISDQIYCELCLTKEKDVKIARKFLNLLLDSEWDNVYMVNNEKAGGDKINELMRLKKSLWKDQEIPVITQKQFKINIENDRIEDYTAVMAREEDIALVKKTFNFLEDTHVAIDL